MVVDVFFPRLTYEAVTQIPAFDEGNLLGKVTIDSSSYTQNHWWSGLESINRVILLVIEEYM